MNITTIGNIPSNNIKRIKGQYIVAAAGIALAAGAIFTTGTADRSVPAPSQPRTATIAAVSSRPATQQDFFIVANEADRSVVLQTLNASKQMAYEAGNFDLADYNVLVAGSQAANVLQGEGSRELMVAGVPFTIYDLTSPVVSAGSAATSRVSDADLAASVLSTELANYAAPAAAAQAADADVLASALSGESSLYDFGATQPVQRVASEADIMASVISTELANFAATDPSIVARVADADVLASARSGESSVYNFDASFPVQRLVSEADIAASVLSTELAHFGR